MMPEPFAVEIRNLNYETNGVSILRDIDLTVKRGEFVGLIGPNGAGKTTLLKCINGINRASGSIKIEGQDHCLMDTKQTALKVALMHQNTVMDFPFACLDVVLMGRYPHLGRMKSESPSDYETARRCMEHTDTLGLQARLVTTVSGGERQRIMFARTLAQETGIILLDEPTASLDITHQEQIFKYALVCAASGMTVLTAVHDLKIASRYCSRLVLMKDGRILADGTPEEVLTGENLSAAYSVNAIVYKNRVTGLLDFHLHNQTEGASKKRVHVIGGGGSSSGIIRLLFEDGCDISSGVFSPGDSDLQCAEVFGIRRSVCNPFSEISDECFRENLDMISRADITILCNMPFGAQNLRNLEAASCAKTLVIVEDEAPEARDFTGGVALERYNALKARAFVTTTARLHEVL